MSDGERPDSAPALNGADPQRQGPRHRQQAHELREAAITAAAAGDYLQARRLDAQAFAQAPDTDVGHEADSEHRALAPDPVALAAGGLGLACVAIAWMLSVW